MLKKILYFLIGFIAILVFGFGLFLYFYGPDLAESDLHIVEKTIAADLPEQLEGDTASVYNQGVKIWYESIYPKDSCSGSVLLFMGISNDAMGWPKYFLDGLVNSGYQVIRADYRGCGLSDWIHDWDKNNPYTLDDMANDGILILDDLGIEKSHILGISLGGMVAQQLAINYPERTASLTSIMSSGYIEDKTLPSINMATISKLVLLSIKYQIFSSEANAIKMQMATRILLNGEAEHELDTKNLAEAVLFNIRQRKGYNPKVSPQHIAATSASGSRYAELKKLLIPTLIIHGYDDPLIPFEHGQKCAEHIPNSKTFWMENMGHNIPRDLNPIIQAELLNHFEANN